MINYSVRDIHDGYYVAFFAFFNVDPISLHGHISDAAGPYNITSLIMYIREKAAIRN